MRGPWVKTPLLLLVVLLTSLTGTAFCQDDVTSEPPETENGSDPETQDAVTTPDPPTTKDVTSTIVEGSGEPGSGDDPISSSTFRNESSDEKLDEGEGLSLITFVIPVVVAVVIIGMIVCGILISRRRNKNLKSPDKNKDDKEDQYLEGSSTEKVPMPMFEEDVPSVLELEMEELDEWMKKDC